MANEDVVMAMGGGQSRVAAAAAAAPAKLQPWVEKYRPKTVDDVAHQDEVTNTLKGAIATGVLPHLLFYGPPGTGKTSTVLALARTLYGPDTYKDRILELNASDERGIQVVREKIKTFAQVAVGRGTHQAGYPCPPFKVIILDEADTMTPDAQSALRRTMETYSTVTRFCLICNYVTRIIEPLASRCAKFRFSALGREPMLNRLRFIAREEDVKITADGLEAIVDLSGGDMRKAVTAMQSASQFYAGVEVTPEVLVDIAGKIPQEVKDNLWSAIKSGSFQNMAVSRGGNPVTNPRTMSAPNRLDVAPLSCSRCTMSALDRLNLPPLSLRVGPRLPLNANLEPPQKTRRFLLLSDAIC